MSKKKGKPTGKKKAPPSYCLHKASGQGVVRIGGRDHYLGEYGTPESRRRYADLIARLDENAPVVPGDASNLTVGEVVSLYLAHAETYYTDRKTGRVSGQLERAQRALAFVTDLHADTPVSGYGPRLLAQARQGMVGEGWTRKHVNQQVGNVKRAFRWAVSTGLCPVGVYQALCALEGLRLGKSEARESEPVLPAPEASIEAVLKVASRTVADMVRLQLLTGMRAG